MNVLFYMLPTNSHHNPVFAIIHTIKSDSVKVKLCADSFVCDYILFQGLEVYLIENTAPFGCGLEKSIIEFEQKENTDYYLDNLINRLSFRIYQDRKKKLITLIEEVKPNIIFIDSFLSTDFIILYSLLKEKNIKLVFLQTMLSTLQSEGSPPLNTHLLPNNQKEVKKIWQKLLWHRKMLRIKDKLRYLGKDDLSMIRQKHKENNIPQEYKIITDTSFNISFANVPEWILAPAELEFFPEKKAAWQTYIGSMIDLNRKEFSDEKYVDFDRKLPQLKQGGKKILYCSFGTLTHLNVEDTILFFKNLLQAIKGKENYILICSGLEEVQNYIPELPVNAYWFRFVPQLRLLSQVDLFITHGGLNSIKESLHFCIPMLIYPMYDKTDNYGNAARIFYHRLGLRGEISQDSPQEIAEKINELLTNPVYKQNLQAFKAKTEAKYTEERLLALFGSLLKEPTPI